MRLRTRLLLTIVAVAVPLVAGAVWLRIDLSRRASIQGLVDFARVRMTTGGKEACEASPITFQEPPLGLRPRDLGPPGPPGRGGPLGPPGGRDSRDPRDPLNARDPLGPRDGLDPLDPRVRDRRGLGGPDGPDGPGGPTPRVELWAYGADFLSANPRAPKFPPDLRTLLDAGENDAGGVVADGAVRTTTVAARMTWTEGPCAIVLSRRTEPRSGDAALVDVIAAGTLVVLLVGAVLFVVGPIVRRIQRLEDGVRRSAAVRYKDEVAIEGSDEIADLARAFNVAGSDVRGQIEAVETRERTLRSFVENTTHDVMLPLTVLQGHLTRMRNELARNATPERATVRDALEESHYLASLVQNLGAAAKLEGGEPNLRHDPFAWNTLVERVILRHKTIAAEKGVELDYAVPDTDVRASGDVTLVEQALSNIVHNAVRYNTSGGHVAVLLTVQDGRFSVRAFDDGPGVSEAELARIAERSYRSDAARARHPDGLGLGLSIASDVAARHGFDFTLKRSEAGGLEVEFRGPVLT